MDKLLLETSFHWLSDDIARFKIKVGFTRNVQKCNKYNTQNDRSAASLLWRRHVKCRHADVWVKRVSKFEDCSNSLGKYRHSLSAF